MSNLASVSPQSLQGASFKGTPPNIASMSPQTLQSASFKGNLPPPVNNGYPVQSFPVQGTQGAVTGMATEWQTVEVRRPKVTMRNQEVTSMKAMQRTVPKFQYDVRTVLVPRQIEEPYTVMETKMVAIQVPKTVMQAKWIQEPREISIPRQIVEKRIIKKLVPKMVEVEEEYEYEVGLTEQEYIEVPHTEIKQVAVEDEEVFYERVPVQVQQPVEYRYVQMQEVEQPVTEWVEEEVEVETTEYKWSDQVQSLNNSATSVQALQPIATMPNPALAQQQIQYVQQPVATMMNPALAQQQVQYIQQPVATMANPALMQQAQATPGFYTMTGQQPIGFVSQAGAGVQLKPVSDVKNRESGGPADYI